MSNPSKVYEKDFGDDKICKCGHPYYRHFDWWNNYVAGCKYCMCYKFEELVPGEGGTGTTVTDGSKYFRNSEQSKNDATYSSEGLIHVLRMIQQELACATNSSNGGKANLNSALALVSAALEQIDNRKNNNRCKICGGSLLYELKLDEDGDDYYCLGH